MAASMEELGRVLGRRRRTAVWAAVSFALLRYVLGAEGHAMDRTSLNDDQLLPYRPPQHGPRHRLRSIRDCHALLHGNATHETWPSDNSSALPLAVTRTFVSYFPPEGQNHREVYGHFTVASNPLRTFSVLEPGGQGGCSSRSTVTVEETARLGKCLVAQNGGYFDTKTGACLGNVVSDGQLVQSSGGVQNAQFGIRKDGTLVFGYLSEEEVLAKENPFVQLVSGVVWLLRDGEVYVNQSWAVECEEIQETGTFERFVSTVSARTAVGHNKRGQLVLVHVDGQTGSRGLSVWEMADFLRQHGVVNAINLDGGGSATLVLNGSLASYPSDHCKSDAMWRCPRNISTVVCVHEPVCQPPDCSGHGQCVRGECRCDGAFWQGPACDVLDCGPSNCSLHGMCTETGCLCDAGWMGANCSEVCSNNSYGDGCAQKCLCRNGGKCDPVHGSCTCPAGYQGALCEKACQVGHYGPSCQHTCQCPNQCPCDPKTGSCNVSYESSALDGLARESQCLLKAGLKEEFIFREKTWIGITSALALLLVLSVIGNVRFLFCSSREERKRGRYTYYPLQDMNGEAGHDCPWDKEDQVEDACAPPQPVSATLFLQEKPEDALRGSDVWAP
ncbi:N-acetylglucosamine-1-phosphodiester alpha-N-acetylglucosaminidase [Hemicordylus capensis]|uniref:N-acetylglucosamine-1-phosphodiester alpha-N-acetylglucosaminidase n=1 Tax=Hemicordylus capensis TaxID=884348 RepID=UPI002303821A|nr:N-acetylglucosamine-1-phosphodiester alpha-N-acetylglucosaminidase [Hemicordylus capensis]